MKIFPAKILAELEVESGVKTKKFQFWRVDRENRWPVQGWSGGDELGHGKLNAADLKEEAAREKLRVFTMDQKSRWPLQGWCKPASRKVDLAEKTTYESSGRFNSKKFRTQRWPQGW